jgi:site-specific DNA recombinase
MGKIAHKGVIYPGMHQAIVEEEVWQKAADLLKENRVQRTRSRNLPSGRLLLGLLFDQDGNRFTPSHASKKGRRYCYYISLAAMERQHSKGIRRIPALEIEQVVATRVRSLLSDQVELSQWFGSLAVRETRLLIAAGQHRAELLSDLSSLEARLIIRAMLKRVVVSQSEAHIELDQEALKVELLGEGSVSRDPNGESGCLRLSCPFAIARRGQQVHIVISAGDLSQSNRSPHS